MFSKDILQSYIIFFKKNYTGSLPVFSRISEVPSDSSYIIIRIGSSNNRFDIINNKHQLLDQPIILEVNLYKNNNPYTPELREIQSLIYSIDFFNAYDFSSAPYQETNMPIRISSSTGGIYDDEGDFQRTTYIINVLNPTGD